MHTLRSVGRLVTRRFFLSLSTDLPIQSATMPAARAPPMAYIDTATVIAGSLKELLARSLVSPR